MKAVNNKGKELERLVMNTVKSLVESHALGLAPEYCQVHMGKGYFSRDRSREIAVDVSIEVWPPKTRGGPSLLWIWECKNYRSPVPVDDLEEFHAKLEQIGADRTKGTVVTTSSYQRSAVDYAVAKGIGLTRIMNRHEIRVESVPGFYLPSNMADLCRMALAHNRGPMAWNAYTYPLPVSSRDVWFFLRGDQAGCAADLRDILIAELSAREG